MGDHAHWAVTITKIEGDHITQRTWWLPPAGAEQWAEDAAAGLTADLGQPASAIMTGDAALAAAGVPGVVVLDTQ